MNNLEKAVKLAQQEYGKNRAVRTRLEQATIGEKIRGVSLPKNQKKQAYTSYHDDLVWFLNKHKIPFEEGNDAAQAGIIGKFIIIV